MAAIECLLHSAHFVIAFATHVFSIMPFVEMRTLSHYFLESILHSGFSYKVLIELKVGVWVHELRKFFELRPPVGELQLERVLQKAWHSTEDT